MHISIPKSTWQISNELLSNSIILKQKIENRFFNNAKTEQSLFSKQPGIENSNRHGIRKESIMGMRNFWSVTTYAGAL
jgi:hypothetical protein